MILNFRHRSLKHLYENDDPRRVNPEHVESYTTSWPGLRWPKGRQDMDLPGFRLYPLTGGRAGTWSVTVRANWRVTFRFEGKDVADVNYEDYH